VFCLIVLCAALSLRIVAFALESGGAEAATPAQTVSTTAR